MLSSAIAMTSRSPLTALALMFAFSQVQCSTSADECRGGDPQQCPSHAQDLSTGMGLLQAKREMQRGYAVEDERQRKTQMVGLLNKASPRLTSAQPPCSCQAAGPDWTRAAPRQPRCLFIDLGAADGNTFKKFTEDGYGPVRYCPTGGDYAAVLVEANPFFDDRLSNLTQNYAMYYASDKLKVLSSTAAYMCEGTTSFYLDTVSTQNNYWGSSLSKKHWDVQASGQKQVTVPLVNVARLVFENALPEDSVIVKMDVEGAEWDIIPCLAQSPEVAKLIDAIYIERHPNEWSLAGTEKGSYDEAIAALNRFGVLTPAYSSPTL